MGRHVGEVAGPDRDLRSAPHAEILGDRPQPADVAAGKEQARTLHRPEPGTGFGDGGGGPQHGDADRRGRRRGHYASIATAIGRAVAWIGSAPLTRRQNDEEKPGSTLRLNRSSDGISGGEGGGAHPAVLGRVQPPARGQRDRVEPVEQGQGRWSAVGEVERQRGAGHREGEQPGRAALAQGLQHGEERALPRSGDGRQQLGDAVACRRRRQHALVLVEAARPVEPVPAADRVERDTGWRRRAARAGSARRQPSLRQ